MLLENKDAFLDVLHKDLHKGHMETILMEWGVALEDIEFALEKLNSWAAPKVLLSWGCTFWLSLVPFRTKRGNSLPSVEAAKGFAYPSNAVQATAPSLVLHGFVPRFGTSASGYQI